MGPPAIIGPGMPPAADPAGPLAALIRNCRTSMGSVAVASSVRSVSICLWSMTTRNTNGSRCTIWESTAEASSAADSGLPAKST